MYSCLPTQWVSSSIPPPAGVCCLPVFGSNSPRVEWRFFSFPCPQNLDLSSPHIRLSGQNAVSMILILNLSLLASIDWLLFGRKFFGPRCRKGSPRLYFPSFFQLSGVLQREPFPRRFLSEYAEATAFPPFLESCHSVRPTVVFSVLAPKLFPLAQITNVTPLFHSAICPLSHPFDFECVCQPTSSRLPFSFLHSFSLFALPANLFFLCVCPFAYSFREGIL